MSDRNKTLIWLVLGASWSLGSMWLTESIWWRALSTFLASMCVLGVFVVSQEPSDE